MLTMVKVIKKNGSKNLDMMTGSYPVTLFT